MINISQIEDTLRTWVITVVDTMEEVIFAFPNAARPNLPYVSINIAQITQTGLDESISSLNVVDDSVDIAHSTMNELFVSINVFSATALMHATQLRDSLSMVTVYEQLYAGGLGFRNAGTINKIPEEINKGFENRAQFDCFFYVRSLDSENIEVIKKIEITDKLNNTTKTIEQGA